MANKPFDYTVINPLERPTSSDLNQMQGQAHADSRLLATKLFEPDYENYTSLGVNGFIGSSFKVIHSPTEPTAVEFVGGIGIQGKTPEDSIGGITGLNDSYRYKALTVDDETKLYTTNPPAAGTIRKDLIMVRALFETERLGGSTVTDIYNPTLNSFGGASRYKTLTSNLSNATVSGSGTPIVYKAGTEFPAATPWASVTAPTADAGYMVVAVLRRTATDAKIVLDDHIEDVRPQLRLSSDKLADGSIINSKLATDAVATANIQASAVTTDRIGPDAVTPAKAAGMYAYDLVLTGSSTTSTTYVDIATLSNVNITGQALTRISIHPGAGGLKLYGHNFDGGQIPRDVYMQVAVSGGPSARNYEYIYKIPAGSTFIPPFMLVDYFGAGTYTIKLQAKCESSVVTFYWDNIVFSAHQL